MQSPFDLFPPNLKSPLSLHKRIGRASSSFGRVVGSSIAVVIVTVLGALLIGIVMTVAFAAYILMYGLLGWMAGLILSFVTVSLGASAAFTKLFFTFVGGVYGFQAGVSMLGLRK